MRASYLNLLVDSSHTTADQARQAFRNARDQLAEYRARGG